MSKAHVIQLDLHTRVNCSITTCHPQHIKCWCESIQNSSYSVSALFKPRWMIKTIPKCDIRENYFFLAKGPHNISFCCCQEPKFTQNVPLLLTCGDCAVPLRPSATCLFLCPTGGVEHHRDGAGDEQVHRLGPAASADPLCRSLCRHGALRTADWLHAADHLPAVQRPLTHQSPKGCHRGVSACYLQVSSDSAEWKCQRGAGGVQRLQHVIFYTMLPSDGSS